MIFNDNLAEVAEKYLRKGAKVFVEGQLQTRKWQDQSGAEKYTTEIVLQRYRGELTMLDGRGEGGGRVTLLGMNRHDWGEWHAWVGYAMAALVVVHLALHWRWLVKIAAAQKPWRLAAGVAAGLAVAGFFLFAPVSR